MSTTILQRPVARATDPITSYEAGETTTARTISHQTVLCCLNTHGAATQAHIVEEAHLLDVPATDQRIRSAFTELEAQGLVRRTGEFDTSGPRRQQLWELTEDGKEATK